MAQTLARPVADLIEAFSRLPGIGPKTASRLTFYLLREPEGLAEILADALQALHSGTVICERCFNIAEQSPCAICADATRDQSTICVVEEPLDVLAIERTGEFQGVYHVLHGALSPINGVYPEKLKIAELADRVRANQPREVILATNPSLEGENTAAYIYQQLSPMGARVTRLARGLPVGGDLEYTDEVTLARALEGRPASFQRPSAPCKTGPTDLTGSRPVWYSPLSCVATGKPDAGTSKKLRGRDLTGLTRSAKLKLRQPRNSAE